MRRIIAGLSALVLVVSLLTGCQGNGLPDGMDETELLTQGREIVALLADEDWQAVYDRMRADGQEKSSAEKIQAYMQALTEKCGAYVEEKDAMATGQTLESGENYGTAVLYCKHEKKNVVYRIAFSTNMEFMGFQAQKQSLFG
ncbi:MAG: DUF3887 domain-containing protein [Lawsonibacter sp.]|nr:DUF3887 domain-containing protein [Lawsonibacter sp.]